MGYDVGRFAGEVDDDLLCSICSMVMEDPLQTPLCEHAFCGDCIKTWLSQQSTCPTDRSKLTVDQLQPPSRLLKNFLAKLKIKCDYTELGCSAEVQLGSLSAHLKECEVNPDNPVVCQLGCDLTMLRRQLQKHKCIPALKNLVAELRGEIQVLKSGDIGASQRHSPRAAHVYWQAAVGGAVPSNAVSAGGNTSEETMYVGRAEHNHQCIPGKVHPSHGVCYVAYNGSEISKTSYEVLVDDGENSLFKWCKVARRDSFNYTAGFTAVKAGHGPEAQALYIGRVDMGGTATPGKVLEGLVLKIPYGGCEHVCMANSGFEVLCWRDPWSAPLNMVGILHQL